MEIIDTITLDVQKRNVVTCAFYKRLGFEMVGEENLYAGDNLDHSTWEPRSLSGNVRLDDKSKIVFLEFELGLKIMR